MITYALHQHTTLTGISPNHPKKPCVVNGRWFIKFAGIFSDSDELWLSLSPAGGCETKEEAVSLTDSQLVEQYV